MKAAAGGCSIGIRVKPSASKEKIVSFDEREVCVAVKAPPIEGKANEAVLRLLADILGVSRSSIVVRRGKASRHKLVYVSCMQKDEVMRKLRVALSSQIIGSREDGSGRSLQVCVARSSLTVFP